MQWREILWNIDNYEENQLEKDYFKTHITEYISVHLCVPEPSPKKKNKIHIFGL